MRYEKTGLAFEMTEPFIARVMQKYHFDAAEKENMRQVAARVQKEAAGQAGFWQTPEENGSAEWVNVAMTLGDGVDRLQETYLEEGRMTECYMAEALAGELLLTLYQKFNRRIREKTGRHVARYRFYGAEEGLPLEEMEKAPVLQGQDEISCNSACCLLPKKSVVFWAELTEEEGRVCEGICAGCGRKDCPNRAKPRETSQRYWPDLSFGPLPYGYARILRGAFGGTDEI